MAGMGMCLCRPSVCSRSHVHGVASEAFDSDSASMSNISFQSMLTNDLVALWSHFDNESMQSIRRKCLLNHWSYMAPVLHATLLHLVKTACLRPHVDRCRCQRHASPSKKCAAAFCAGDKNALMHTCMHACMHA